jgi:ribonuclease Z
MIEIVFLGTSGMVPTKERSQSAISLRYEGDYFLFDCGEGTQRQMKLAKVSPMKVKGIFVTHLHGDHIYGIAPLLDTLTFFGRTDEITIYGPVGIAHTIELLERIGYSGQPEFAVKVVETKGGIVLDTPEYFVETFPTKHTTPSVGYVFQEKEKTGRFNREKALSLGIPESKLWSQLQSGKAVEYKGKKFTPDMVLGGSRPGKKIVYTGDTMPCESVINNSKGADILIHEATFDNELAEKAKQVKHSTARDAAGVAVAAQVQKLILTHLSQRYDEGEDVSALLKEAREVFKNTEVAYDLARYEL